MASHDLPPYPQMILEAIDALEVPVGLDKSSISEYIENKFEEVPSDHEDQLEAHLAKMKESGELLLVNNNYLKPGATTDSAPPKRGRGRPPKAKDPNAVEPAGPPRPRGRPPGKVDPNATPSAKKQKAVGESSGSGRPRGRPKKVKPVEDGVEA